MLLVSTHPPFKFENTNVSADTGFDRLALFNLWPLGSFFLELGVNRAGLNSPVLSIFFA
jgi:hypothetical protein